jgi:DNA-directed RNA polymerase subunit RPC12/RpoP
MGELWKCNNCQNEFNVKSGSYDTNKGEWPRCPDCGSQITEMED